jgi:hypothetical protein
MNLWLGQDIIATTIFHPFLFKGRLVAIQRKLCVFLSFSFTALSSLSSSFLSAFFHFFSPIFFSFSYSFYLAFYFSFILFLVFLSVWLPNTFLTLNSCWLLSLSAFVFLSFCLSVFLSFCLSVFLSFCLSVFLSFYFSLLFHRRLVAIQRQLALNKKFTNPIKLFVRNCLYSYCIHFTVSCFIS